MPVLNIDSDYLATLPPTSPLTQAYPPGTDRLAETVFGWRDADPVTGPRCGRCGRLDHLHLWQIITDLTDQNGVIDCATLKEGR